uniref:MHC class II DR alpha chain n=2 Tax=Canis lupus familiaris TaxID=9615 RepID=A0A8I3NY87_CANLF
QKRKLPKATIYPRKSKELGEPNILICFIDKFSPPVINVTWLRNGNPVTTGVSETIFLPREDHLFRKFHYLPFLPSAEDVYDCKVEHWGLDEPLLKHWDRGQANSAQGSRMISGFTFFVYNRLFLAHFLFIYFTNLKRHSFLEPECLLL